MTAVDDGKLEEGNVSRLNCDAHPGTWKWRINIRLERKLSLMVDSNFRKYRTDSHNETVHVRKSKRKSENLASKNDKKSATPEVDKNLP